MTKDKLRDSAMEQRIRECCSLQSILEDYSQLRCDVFAYTDGETAVQFYSHPRTSVIKEATILSDGFNMTEENIAIFHNALTFVEDNMQIIPSNREPLDD